MEVWLRSTFDQVFEPESPGADVAWRPATEDILAIIGLALVGVGLWWIEPAAALIVVGLFLIAAGYRIGLGKARIELDGTGGTAGTGQPNGEPEQPDSAAH